MTKCSVALPHSVTGWSAVCDCGISWSYLLFLFADFLSCGDKYCKFRFFHEGFMRSFMKIESSRNDDFTLSLTEKGKSWPSHEFSMW